MLWPWSKIRALEIENWQLKAALGYPIPSSLERDVEPNPFQCGLCAARKKNPWLFRDEFFKERKDVLNPVERNVIDRALELSRCADEFDSDLSRCHEGLNGLQYACNTYNRAMETRNEMAASSS